MELAWWCLISNWHLSCYRAQHDTMPLEKQKWCQSGTVSSKAAALNLFSLHHLKLIQTILHTSSCTTDFHHLEKKSKPLRMILDMWVLPFIKVKILSLSLCVSLSQCVCVCVCARVCVLLKHIIANVIYSNIILWFSMF